MANYLLARESERRFAFPASDKNGLILITHTRRGERDSKEVEVSVTDDSFAELHGIKTLREKKFIFTPMLRRLLLCDRSTVKILRRGSWEKILVEMYREERLKEKKELISKKKFAQLLNSPLSADENLAFEQFQK